MADKVKEFYNGTLTGADVSGTNNDEFVIIQNDAATQAVIKDVVVQSLPLKADGLSTTVTMVNGNTDLGDAVTSTGTEIVDVNGTFKYRINPPLDTSVDISTTLTSFSVLSTSTVNAKKQKYAVVKNNIYPYNLTDLALVQKYVDATATSSDVNATFVNQGVPGMTSPVWYYEIGNNAYYFYYDGNATTQLQHATITNGVVGAWGNVDSSSYAYKTLDLSSNICYYQSGTSVYKVDLSAGSLSGNLIASGMAYGASTLSSSGAANGLFVCFPSSSYTSNFNYYDTNTSTKGTFSCHIPYVSSIYQNLAVVYNPSEDMYYIIVGYGTTQTVYSIANGFTGNATLTTVSDNSSTSWFPNGVTTNGQYMQGDSYGNLFIINANNNLEKLHISNGVAISVSIDTSVTPLTCSGWFEVMGTPTAYTTTNSDYNITLDTKVSGVEIK